MKSEINHSKDWANCNGSSRNLAEILKNDTRVQLAGIDCDGQLRGKVMSKEKFLSIVDSGFGMSSAIFGWDMHDMLFDENNTIASSEQGYADFTSVVDQLSMRRLPWAQNMPFFLLRFTANDRAVSACGRSMIKIFSEALAVAGCRGVAGGMLYTAYPLTCQFVLTIEVELEFFNYQTPSEDGYHDQNPSKRKNLAAFLRNHQPSELRPLTDGMFGYSITRPMASSDFFFDVIDTCARLDCQIESWHTESGPGVFEGVSLLLCRIFRCFCLTLCVLLFRHSAFAKWKRWRTGFPYSSKPYIPFPSPLLAYLLKLSDTSLDVSVIYMVSHLAFWRSRSLVFQETRDISIFP